MNEIEWSKEFVYYLGFFNYGIYGYPDHVNFTHMFYIKNIVYSF